MTPKASNVFEEVVAKNGPEKQLNILQEEMAELTVAISKFSRGLGSIDNIAEEIADVEIMLREAEIIFDCANKTAAWRIRKINELQERVKGGGRPL